MIDLLLALLSLASSGSVRHSMCTATERLQAKEQQEAAKVAVKQSQTSQETESEHVYTKEDQQLEDKAEEQKQLLQEQQHHVGASRKITSRRKHMMESMSDSWRDTHMVQTNSTS